MVILTKDLNDGDNYNRKIIKECIEMISKLKIENAKKEINIENNKMNNVAIVVNGKYKTYYAIYNDGLFIMYKSKRGSIDSFMYVKMKEELIYVGLQFDFNYKNLNGTIFYDIKTQNYEIYQGVHVWVDNISNPVYYIENIYKLIDFE